jgi:hypothetical protein
MWAILLIVWIVGVPVAYVVVDGLDVAEMRRWQWTEEGIEDSRRAWRGRLCLLSLASWFMVAGSIKVELDNKRRRAKIEKGQRDLEELRQHIERMDWK